MYGYEESVTNNRESNIRCDASKELLTVLLSHTEEQLLNLTQTANTLRPN